MVAERTGPHPSDQKYEKLEAVPPTGGGDDPAHGGQFLTSPHAIMISPQSPVSAAVLQATSQGVAE